MEKHNRKDSLYEIFHVMTTMLSKDGKFESNLNDVVAYCQTIRNDNHGIFTTVIDSEGIVDLPNFLHTFLNAFPCSVFSYQRQRLDNDTFELMRKLGKFLQANGLNERNLITFNFPSSNIEFLKCKAAGFSPNNVIKIISKSSDKPAKSPEVEFYFESNTQLISLTNNVKENCDRLKNAIDHCTYTSSLNRDSGFHLQRIILLGQIGSGRKTQAILLAERWNLVFLDFRVLLLEYAKLNKSFDDQLTNVRRVHQLNRKLMASILFDRITKRDCLENGWILVGYVSSVTDLEIMESQFFIIPNKIVFIHCRQYLCLDRLRARVIKRAKMNECRYSDEVTKYAKLGFLDLYSPCCAINHIVTEIDHFCRNRKAILKYCQDRAKYIAHIDGEHRVSTVTTLLWGQLEKFYF